MLQNVSPIDQQGTDSKHERLTVQIDLPTTGIEPLANNENNFVDPRLD